MRHITVTVLVCVFCLTQLSGCGIKHHSGFAEGDGPPHFDVDSSKIKDAVPKVEPYHPYGRKNYVVRGKRYRVLKSAKGYVRHGYASWYGSKFHGNQTSTQESFNMYGMTAASPHLPLPTYVQVTNLRNGKKIVVKVNDRGPFRKNRLIDLSYAAAKKLDFVEKGVTRVKVVAIDPKTWGKKKKKVEKKVQYAKSKSDVKKKVVQSKKAKQSNKQYAQKKSQKKKLFLQVGAFSELDNAKELSGRVNKVVNKPVRIEHKSDLYRVHIGPIASSAQGDKLKVLLEKNGFKQISMVGG